jgi:hypothetical protein
MTLKTILFSVVCSFSRPGAGFSVSIGSYLFFFFLFFCKSYFSFRLLLHFLTQELGFALDIKDSPYSSMWGSSHGGQRVGPGSKHEAIYVSQFSLGVQLKNQHSYRGRLIYIYTHTHTHSFWLDALRDVIWDDPAQLVECTLAVDLIWGSQPRSLRVHHFL